MTGIEAGKTWSRIGAEVAPTDSAASGVWGSLNEVAGYVGAGTWPAVYIPGYILFAAVSPTGGSAGPVTISNIPQDARDLVIFSRPVIQSSSSKIIISPNSSSVTNNDFQLLVGMTGNNPGTAVNATDETGTNAMSNQNAGGPTQPLEQVSTIYNYSSTTKEKTILTETASVGYPSSDSSGEISWSTTQFAGIGSAAITSISFIFASSTVYNSYYQEHAYAVYGLGSAV
jgi:hypothetical protein